MNGSLTRLPAAWALNDDGSFAYQAGDLILEDCYPSFNGRPAFAKSVQVTRRAGGGEIIYHVRDGKITLTFSADGDSLVLGSSLEVPVAPHWFYPLGCARVRGADRFFKQGIGFSGPSGIIDVPKTPRSREARQPNEAWAYDSYVTAGFFSPAEHALAIGAYRHDRFLQRSSYHNRPYRYNLVDRHLESDDLYFEAGFATEELPLTGALELPALHFIAGQDPFGTFHHLAQNIAKDSKVAFDNGPHYQVCTFWEFMLEFDQARLDEMLAGLTTIRPATPLETIQVDGGYCAYGDWLTGNHRFPKGVQHMARSILDAGYKPGIWIAPFAVDAKSDLAREHPQWLLRTRKGRVHVEGTLDGAECNILDTTHPEAFAHLRSVFRTYRKWGFTYYKTDFLEWGMRDRTRWPRHDNRTTSVEHMTEIMKMIRQEIGPDSFWVGCITLYGPAIGHADAVRISNDVPAGWNDGSHGNLIQEAFAMQYLQQVFWQNDPDCIFLRDVYSALNSKLSRDEAYTLAYWDAMIGGFVTTSDRFHKITPSYLKLWRFVQPGAQQMSCRFPYWSRSRKLRVAVRDFADGSAAVLVLNPWAETVKEEMAVKDLVGADSAWFFAWRPGENTPEGRKSTVTPELKPHQSALYYVSRENTPPDEALNLFGIRPAGL